MRKKWLVPVALGVVLAGGGVALRRNRAAAPPPAKAAPIQLPLPRAISLAGTIQAQHVVNIAAPVTGVVAAFLVEVGQEVAEGQLIVQLRSEGLEAAQTSAQTEVERAQTRVSNLDGAVINARLEASRAQADASRLKGEHDRLEKIYQRQQLLAREGATPRLTFEKAEREYQAAVSQSAAVTAAARAADERVASLAAETEAAKRVLAEKTQSLDTVQAQVASADVRAPAAGVVIGRHGVAGDRVDPGVRDLIQIGVDLQLLQVVLEPDPPLLKHLHAGLPALVHVAEAANGLPGSIREIKGNQVIVEFANPLPAVRPGLTAQVQIRLS